MDSLLELNPPPAIGPAIWRKVDAGMFALRERRIHVTQEDFEMAVSKVMKKDSEQDISIKKLWK